MSPASRKILPIPLLPRRYASSQQHDQERARQQVKKHVRRLYQHIHPDRLAQHPKQRSINESSFQILQSALDTHLKPWSPTNNNNSSRHSHSQTSCELTFFANKSDGTNGLIKAHVIFQETRLASVLLDLFKKFGLKDAPSASTLSTVFPSSSAPTAASSNDLGTLIDLARKQRNPFASTTSTAGASVNETQILLHGLQRRYGVNVQLEDGYVKSRALIVLRRLASVLTSLEENGDSIIRAASIHIDGERSAGTIVSYGDDSLVPVVRLGAMGADSEWLSALECRQVVEGCEKARVKLQRLHGLQVRAAWTVGVRLMASEVSVLEAKDRREVGFILQYEKLLSELLVASPMEEDVTEDVTRVTSMRNRIAIMITKSKPEMEMDENQGMIRVCVDSGVEGIRKAVGSAEAMSMAQRFQRLCATREADRRLTESVRRELGLQRLRRVEGVLSDAQWRDGLFRLRRRRSDLKRIMAGVSVSIGLHTRLLNGGDIEVAHDFQIK